MTHHFTDGLSMRDYLSIDALSSSQIKWLLRGRPYYVAQKAAPPKTTPDMLIGTAVHSLLLTPESLKDEVAVAPREGCGTRNTKTYREWAKDQPPWKALLLDSEYRQAKAAAAAVREHEAWGTYIANLTGTERTCTWTDDAGRHCKARIDAWIDGDAPDSTTQVGDYIIDVKTCHNSGTEHVGTGRPFHYVAWDYAYHIQLAWYRRAWQTCVGRPVLGTLILAVEKLPPYQARIWDLTSWMDTAEKQIDMALGNLDAYVEPTDIRTLPLPGWAKHQE